MRKIEHNMIQAIRDGKVWSNGNTVVDIVPVMGSLGNDPDKYCAEVYLHGSNIACLIINRLDSCVEFCNITSTGYRTNVTKSRINALIQAFSTRYIGVVQKKGALYMVANVGNLEPITTDGWYCC